MRLRRRSWYGFLMRSKEVVDDVDGVDHDGEENSETPEEDELKASSQKFRILKA